MAQVDLRHIRAFVAVLGAGSYTKAASELNVTQPSVSRLVDQLERYYGQRLIARDQHPARATPFGERVLPHARRALAGFEDTIRVEQDEQLTVGFAWNVAGPLTTAIIEEFEREHPTAQVLLRRHNSVLAGLEDGLCDVAWVRAEPPSSTWGWVEMFREKRVAVVSRHHRLADRDRMDLDEVRAEPLVLNTVSGTTTVDLWPDPSPPRVTLAVTNTEEWLNEIALGRGIGVGVASTFEFHRHSGVRAIPLTDARPVVVRLAWPRRSPHPLCGTYVDAARRVVGERAAPSGTRRAVPAPTLRGRDRGTMPSSARVAGERRVTASVENGLPDGFRAHTGRLGFRGDGDDIALIVADDGAACAGVFTRSRFAGPSVQLSRPRAATGRAGGVVVVAMNANVATGPEGRRNAAELADLAHRAAGLPTENLLVASTGVIGRPYRMPTIREHFAGPLAFDAGPSEVATAIMTTDTRPKTARARVGPASVVGIAKGVGMLEPDMATMLAFVLTDAEVAPARLDELWRAAVNPTLNCLSVDTDTSTSDTAVVLASGAVGSVDEDELARALRQVCLELTLDLARDGEGATKLLMVTTTGARDGAQATRVAKAVLNSPLVKTAMHGADPNWGRVAMAVGKCSDDTDIDPERVRIAFGELAVYPHREGVEPDLDRLRAIMSADEVTVTVDLGITDHDGPHRATVYGCDLSAGYVHINADYTT